MPARRVFLDTNGWLALLNSADALHSLAEAEWTQLLEEGYSIFLTDWIIAETGNGLARTTGRSQFVQAVRLLRESPRAHVLPVSGELFERALDLYAKRLDKTWGLVDCASFIVMEDEGIREVLSNDRHFPQAGFQCLLPLP
ncbi:MAG TPA: PIN domain-containing protein [Thermoanaerobaculia bacterium]